MRANKQALTHGPSYWKVFRLIFVIFSLYILRDAFFRWDGFRYHSSFTEFVPSFALVTIFWTLTAASAALLVWLLLKGIEWFCRRIGRDGIMGPLVLFISILSFLLIMTLIVKGLVFKESLTLYSKLIVSLIEVLIAVFLTWRFRNDTDVVNDRITPLVWLFGTWFIVAFFIVFYHAGLSQEGGPEMQPRTSAADVRPNIVLVIFDAMSARNMSVYGYERPTTPFIDEWSGTASLFKRFKASSNWTTSSMASLMTGKRVWTHRTFHEHSIPLRSDIESLPRVLKNHGYQNMAFVANPYASIRKLGIDNSFDIAPPFYKFAESRNLIGWKFGQLDLMLTRAFEGKIKFFTWIITPDFILGKLIRAVVFRFSEISQTEVPPEKLFEKYFEALDNNMQEPFFAWIHLYPPHDPYLPGEPYIGMFDDSTKLRTLNDQMEELTWQRIDNEKHWEIFRARYDEFIRYCDKKFEALIAELKQRDLLKNTIIIFTSDHGESFEHGYFTHGKDHLYEQVTHVPLMIMEPDQDEGRVFNELVEQIDLPPTILDLAGIPVPLWMEGRSLLPLMRGEELPARHVYSMSFQKNPSTGGGITKGTVAVWEGDYKLIHYIEDNRSILFDLRKDPDELVNLFDEKKEIALPLLDLIHENLKKADERRSVANNRDLQ